MVSLGCAIVVQAQQRSADDPWWFEIEAIVFERSVKSRELLESFPLKVKPIDTAELPSFISNTLYPDFSLLRMGAKQCLTEDKPYRFPKQTVAAPNFSLEPNAKTSDFDDESSFIKDYFRNMDSRKRFLDSYNLSVPEYVIKNSPSQKWQNQLENLFSDLNQSLKDWREHNTATWGLKLFPMSEYSIIDTRPEIRLPDSFYCNWAEELEYFETEFARELKTGLFLNSVPKIIKGIEYPFSEVAYILPAEKLQMSKLRRDIQRRKGLNVILHTAWRQNVVTGRERAPWYRFYAGLNFSREYQYNGLPVAEAQSSESALTNEQRDIFDEIQDILEQPATSSIAPDAQPGTAHQEIAALEFGEGFKEVWTLDGRLKVFIEYIGGTPYLHIDSDLNYRQPVFIDWKNNFQNSDPADSSNGVASVQESEFPVVADNNFLQAYHFDQLRRVISNEIHYFDHPLFGMVLQIRRHKRPDPELPPDYYD